MTTASVYSSKDKTGNVEAQDALPRRPTNPSNCRVIMANRYMKASKQERKLLKIDENTLWA